MLGDPVNPPAVPEALPVTSPLKLVAVQIPVILTPLANLACPSPVIIVVEDPLPSLDPMKQSALPEEALALIFPSDPRCTPVVLIMQLETSLLE